MSETPNQLNDRKERILSEIGELKRKLQQKNNELKEINDELGIIPKKKNTKRKRDEIEEQQVTDDVTVRIIVRTLKHRNRIIFGHMIFESH